MRTSAVMTSAVRLATMTWNNSCFLGAIALRPVALSPMSLTLALMSRRLLIDLLLDLGPPSHKDRLALDLDWDWDWD